MVEGWRPLGLRVAGEIVSSDRVDGVGDDELSFLSWSVDEVLLGILEACIVPLINDSEDVVMTDYTDNKPDD